MFHKTSLLTVFLFLCITITVFGAWPSADNVVTPPGATLGWDNIRGEWRPLGSSLSDGALSTLDYEHHKIHEGRHFLFQESYTLASGAIASYVIQAPPSTSGWAHMIFSLDGSTITQFDLFEATDHTGVATATTYNHNRNSSNIAATYIYKGVVASSTNGNLIKTYKGGSAQGASRTGAYARGTDELILKADTKYHFIVTSGAADNLINVKMLWYEQQP